MIQEFIKNNSLSLKPGSRNSTITTLIGYAQHSELSKSDLEKELETEINNDSFIQEEVDRLWDYCKVNNYKSFWVTPRAKARYKF